MRRFMLRENIEKFEAALQEDGGARERQYIVAQLAAMRRELAMLQSKSMGALRYAHEAAQISIVDASQCLRLIEDSTQLYMVIDPRPGLHIVDVNDGYAAATLTRRHAIAGQPLFDVFPDNPELSGADGVSNLYNSIQDAVAMGSVHRMAVQRYDVRDPLGTFVTRYWRPANTPIFNDAGELILILHHVEDVTERVGIVAGDAQPPD